MKTKRVLTVGHCGFDHFHLAELVSGSFGAEAIRAVSMDDAFVLLRSAAFDLVLANRLFHGSGQEGLDLVRQLKLDPDLHVTPVMLVSNYAESQAEAVAAGAEPGFGKDHLDRPETVELLRRFLG